MKKYIKHLILIVALVLTSAIFVTTPKTSNNYSENVSIVQQQEILPTEALPSRYDLREKIAIGVEDQNPYGICFAYASLTSLETYLALNYGEYYDFSELHFALSLYLQDGYYTNVEDALYNGGNFSQFDLYAQKDKSIVLEEEMPMSKYFNINYNRYDAMKNDYNNINSNFYTIAKINGTSSFPQYAGNKAEYSSIELANFRNSVKQHLMTNGSLTAGIYTGGGSLLNYNATNFRVTDDSLLGDKSTDTLNKRIDHLISIVGWDDNYNANGAWANKGAYLCLNSWGTGFGDKGYFYVSYDDYFIEYTIQGVTSASLATTNNRISTITSYQKDTCLLTHTFGSDIYIANIVNVSNYINKQIEYIDAFSKGDSTSFYINFYSSYDNAVNGIASIDSSHKKSSTLISTNAIYEHHKLDSSLTITNDYIVVIQHVRNASKIYSLASRSETYASNPEFSTFYSTSGNFALDSKVWDPPVSEFNADALVPIVLHTKDTYVQVEPFTGDAESLIDSKYIQNNAIYYGKTIKIKLNNATLTNTIVNNVKITKLGNNSFADVSSAFSIQLIDNIINVTMTSRTSSSFAAGNYLVKIPLGDGKTIYRILNVQSATSFTITYDLDGGTANNPSVYSDAQESLHLNPPLKIGYTFVGWYLDKDFTNEFNPNVLPYTNLMLYAKYDIALPKLISKSNNISITYYNDLIVEIMVTASHPLLNEFNSLSYQWYTRKTTADEYIKVEGATNNKLRLSNVAQSGYYACEISINISDPSIIDVPYSRKLEAGENTEILVNINPYIYDMSKAQWNYTSPISYDTKVHTLQVINLPVGVTAHYTGNVGSAINTYTAHAELIYDDMDGNAIINPIEDLVWEIRRAKIIITIDDIVTTQEIGLDTLSGMYSCTIDSEYLPDGISTFQDKLDYLELVYQLQDTSQRYIKTITATTKSYDIHEIVINNGKYRVVVDELSNGSIKAVNNNGFVKDCILSITSYNIDAKTSKALNEQHLSAVQSYDISYSYLDTNDIVTISIPLDRKTLFNNISVYMVKDGKLSKVDNLKITTNGISFDSSELNATYIIAETDNSHITNAEYIVMICVGGGFLALYLYIIIHKRHKRYR